MENLWALWAMPARTESTRLSTFLEYVWPDTGIAAVEAHLLSDHLIGLAAFLMIPVKELQEAGLGSGGSLGAKQLHGADHMIQVLKIQAETPAAIRSHAFPRSSAVPAGSG